MRWLDDFIIDRLFQPIADALARWISCYGLAAFFLTGAILAAFGDMAMNMTMIADFTLVIICTSWLIQAHRLDSSWKKDALPENRIIDIITRVVWLLLVVGVIPLKEMYLMPVVYNTYLMDSSYVLQLIALYFMACRPNPPLKWPQQLNDMLAHFVKNDGRSGSKI